MTSTNVLRSENGYSLVELLSEPDKKVIGYAILDSNGNIVAGPFDNLGDAFEAFDSFKDENDDEEQNTHVIKPKF